MRAVIQRVSDAKVIADDRACGEIGKGYLILLGIEDADTQDDADWLAQKIASLRVFNDPDGLMNQSIVEVGGNALVVSQFTLHAKYKKGNRPSFIRAARPEHAEPLYERFCTALTGLLERQVERGLFGAHMHVHLTNDGPVTILMDTKNKE